MPCSTTQSGGGGGSRLRGKLRQAPLLSVEPATGPGQVLLPDTDQKLELLNLREIFGHMFECTTGGSSTKPGGQDTTATEPAR